MYIWWFMFFCNLLVPVIQIVAGKMMWKSSPGKINKVYGYRTKRSMKNMDTWEFAHEHCGRVWWRVGWVTLIVSILAQLPFMHSSEDVSGVVAGVISTLQVCILVLSIFPTERALKKTFYDDGTRR